MLKHTWTHKVWSRTKFFNSEVVSGDGGGALAGWVRPTATLYDTLLLHSTVGGGGGGHSPQFHVSVQLFPLLVFDVRCWIKPRYSRSYSIYE